VSHSELVAIATHWLGKKCPVVIQERCSSATEIPDVIGFSAMGDSTIIECKTDLQGFKVDAKKECRARPAMGLFRFYMAPLGLIQAEQLPLSSWGLIETDGRRFTSLQASSRHERNFIDEIRILTRALSAAEGHLKSANVEKHATAKAHELLNGRKGTK